MKITSCACIFLAGSSFVTPAIAADGGPPLETVVVNASALTGLWKIRWPDSGRINLHGGAEWGPLRDRFCRIEQVKSDLAIHCFAGGLARDGTVSLDGDNLHLAFGNMLLRTFVDASLQSGMEFSGHQGVKISGVEYDNPDESTGTKVIPSAAAPDPSGKAALLRTALEELAKGPLTLPHDDAAIAKSAGGKPGDVRLLGGILTVAYLGQAPRMPAPKSPDAADLDFFSVYAVEFDNGERICGLHQRADGVLDAFLCL